MGPSVARVSAPSTTPSLKMHPTMVVPVEVAVKPPRPWLERKVLREKLEKSNPLLEGPPALEEMVAAIVLAFLDTVGMCELPVLEEEEEEVWYVCKEGGGQCVRVEICGVIGLKSYAAHRRGLSVTQPLQNQHQLSFNLTFFL